MAWASQRECGVTKPLRVAPLFETLDDLDHSESAMEQLLSNKWCGALVCMGATLCLCIPWK